MNESDKKHAIQIEVNERPVTMQEHEATGMQIKKAAIEQHVPIQLDFVLSEELGERRSRVIGDNDRVKLQEHRKFIAVAPDDNS